MLDRLELNSNADQVSMVIHLADQTMQYREFAMNMIEATKNCDQPEMKAMAIQLGDVSKLAFVNNGDSMSASELRSLMDIGSSGSHKQQGLRHNFGQGAKAAGLKANKEGLQYYSCHKMECHSIGIGVLSDGTFGVTDPVSPVEESTALDLFGKDFYSDWVAVVLLGDDLDRHDTTKHPFKMGEEHPFGVNWLCQVLEMRFWMVPHGISVLVASDHGTRVIRGLQSQELVEETWVEYEPGVRIRYGLTPEDVKHKNKTHGHVGHFGFVHGNEVYGMLTNKGATRC